MTFQELTDGLPDDLIGKLKSLGKGNAVSVSMPIKDTIEITVTRGKSHVTVWCKLDEFRQLEQRVHQHNISWEEFLLQVING